LSHYKNLSGSWKPMTLRFINARYNMAFERDAPKAARPSTLR